jgi:hypothetical protein
MATIHAARLDDSPELQRLARVLATGGEYSTMELIHATQIAAAPTRCSELRANGIPVECDARWSAERRKNIYYYRAADPAALRARLAQIAAAQEAA